MKSAATSPASKAARPLIFIVDDEPAMLQVLAICLRRAGYEIQSFCEPLEAIQKINTAGRKPTILLSDYQMPGMNGMELIRRCKDRHPALKTICFSGTLSLSEIVNLSELKSFGARPDRFIAKPFLPRDLLEFVKDLLR